MEQSTEKTYIQKLTAGNKSDLLLTIQELRLTGNERILPYILALLAKNDAEINTAVFDFIKDLKNQMAVLPLMEYFKSNTNKQYVFLLLDAFWQSNLKFEAYLTDFVNMFIQYDFSIAFEAFTIIENFQEIVAKEQIISSIALLQANIPGFDADKANIAGILMAVIQNLRTE